MASLRRQPRSPYWWIQFKDPVTRKVRRVSTGLRCDNPAHTHKARELRTKRELDERRMPRDFPHMRWSVWVIDFLKRRHGASPKTLTRKLGAWRILSAYLQESSIPTPVHLSRDSCLAYLDWRERQGNLRTKKRKGSINTRILELKILGSIVQEAVRRSWIPANPCYRLEIARSIPKEKPEMTDEMIDIIRKAIAQKLASPYNDGERRNAEFLRVSFEVAIHQGCRLSETYLSLEDVDFDNMEIRFLAKGRAHYVAPLSPKLVPLLKELRERGQEFTYDKPRMPSLVWFKFMDMLRGKHPQLKNVSFHSTRVAVVSRLGRAGVPERVAMKLVNHGSSVIHRIYRRIDRSELKQVWSALDGVDRRPQIGSQDSAPTSP